MPRLDIGPVYIFCFPELFSPRPPFSGCELCTGNIQIYFLNHHWKTPAHCWSCCDRWRRARSPFFTGSFSVTCWANHISNETRIIWTLTKHLLRVLPANFIECHLFWLNVPFELTSAILYETAPDCLLLKDGSMCHMKFVFALFLFQN